ncbi:hypothetical protein M758_5G111300 [Ceratodon purpureus]|uniref:Small-subunit processome Utp12 domain-containing protein n=1 Tax=Ceratodon purpureus TaxID=3225 RepID=A0A8T0I2P3_CERPU|nr:hypothetical protein KC19_5G118300 [Ceratodon purpureus]KAG0616391.1 hypothetical protein M758_5G111300 [Ceratodon purpureus]
MNFKFSNLLGAPYRGGNITFKKDTILLSAVGNRVSVTDLQKSEATTLRCENGKSVSRIEVSPDGALLLSVDEDGRSILVNLHTHQVLHHFSFKGPVGALKFSPDGKLIAAGVGKVVQLWRTPGFHKVFAPFELVKSLAGCHDSVTCIGWSSDSSWLVVGSKDLTVKVFSVNRLEDYRSVTLSGHRDVLVGAYFAKPLVREDSVGLYTVSRDGALFEWRYVPKESVSMVVEDDVGKKKMKSSMNLTTGKWELVEKRFFKQTAKLTTCDYHQGLGIIVVGFSTGIFGIYQLPDFTCYHLLSISSKKISTVAFNGAGNWIALGCANLGQLLVWEWRTESQILKQQGHYFDVNCLAFSPDSQYLASGADDNKLKLWNVASGSCFVTFTEHTNSITAVLFLPTNHVVVSASLDGTVRAYDMIRYRNFKTFTTPTPTQFVSLAADQSGEIICAGTVDGFQIYVWSVKTGRLLDVLSGHEGPVYGLSFSPTSEMLASSSWDKTVKLWDVFEGKGNVETFTHTHDVLTVVYRPDSKQIACSTLDGHIHFWDPIEGVEMASIDGRRDIRGGRLMGDRRTAENSSAGKAFTSLSYSADGTFILAGGSSKYICMYDVAEQVLLRRIQITNNKALDGVLDVLNSKRMTSDGPIDLIDDRDSDDDDSLKQSYKQLGAYLPGTKSNFGRPIARSKALQLAPTGRTFAAATTEGLLIYSIDDNLIYDPVDLAIDVTPEAIYNALEEKLYARALVLALRLNEPELIRKCIESVPPEEITPVVSSIPVNHLVTLCTALGEYIVNSVYLEFLLLWCQEVVAIHGKTLEARQAQMLPALRGLQKSLISVHEDLSDLCSSNLYMLQYLSAAPSPLSLAPVTP